MISGHTYVKKGKCSIFVLSMLLSTMQVVGCHLSLEHHTSVHSRLEGLLAQIPTGIWVLIWAAEVLVCYAFLQWIFEKADCLQKPEHSARKEQKRLGFIAFAMLGLLLCWLPVLLSNLPGFFNYDASGQVIQVMYPDLNVYNTHHSLISTLVMGGVITFGYQMFGTLSAGVFLYSCFQMCLCACTFAYSLYFIYQKTYRWFFVWAGFLFYAFSPTIAMFSMSTTKDVICSLFTLLAAMLIFDLLEDSTGFFGSWQKPSALILCCILASMFRKNIIYAVVLFAVIGFFLTSEKKQTLFLFVSAIVGFFVLSAALEWALDAEKGGTAEAYSVPIQQIGYLYDTFGEEAFSEEELAFLYQIADAAVWEEYSPFISDNIKNRIHADFFAQHKKEFVFLWVRKGLQYPGKYLKAFLNLTYQAWYPGTSICQEEIYYFDFYGKNFPIDKTTYIPALTEFYRKISLEFFYQKIPGIRLLCSLGFMFWMLLIALFRGIYAKQKMLVGMTLFAACICLTCLAGPVSLVRYYLILFYVFPVETALVFHYKKSEQK